MTPGELSIMAVNCLALSFIDKSIYFRLMQNDELLKAEHHKGAAPNIYEDY
jgi:hypothetical protein